MHGGLLKVSLRLCCDEAVREEVLHPVGNLARWYDEYV